MAEPWFYTETVKDHFFNPRNIFKTEEEIKSYKADGVGEVGSPACVDVMKMWIKVKDDRIVDCKLQTFGCASAIASTSMLSVIVTEHNGMLLDKALAVKPQDIVSRLGELPLRKFHCSVLGHRALRAAINDYFKKSGQVNRMIADEGEIKCGK